MPFHHPQILCALAPSHNFIDSLPPLFFLFFFKVGDVERSGVSWGMRDDGDDGNGEGTGEEEGKGGVELPEYLKNSKGKGSGRPPPKKTKTKTITHS